MKPLLVILFSIIMLAGTVNHSVNPHFYDALIPPFISETFAMFAAILLEGTVFLLLIIPITRRIGVLAFLMLMVAFLPLHIWDLFKENPMIDNIALNILRLMAQLLLIYASWWLWQHMRPVDMDYEYETH